MGCCSDGPSGLISTFCPCWHSELQARVIPGGGRVLADKRGRMDFFKVNCCSPVCGVSQCCNGLYTLCIAAQSFIFLPDLSLACLANQPSFFYIFLLHKEARTCALTPAAHTWVYCENLLAMICLRHQDEYSGCLLARLSPRRWHTCAWTECATNQSCTPRQPTEGRLFLGF